MSNIIRFYPKGYLTLTEQAIIIDQCRDELETRAICAAIESRQKLTELNRDLAQAGLPQRFNADF